MNGQFKKGKINGNGIYVSGNGNILEGYVLIILIIVLWDGKIRIIYIENNIYKWS